MLKFMNFNKVGLLLWTTILLSPLQANSNPVQLNIDTTASHYYLFSYFMGQDKGMCYAISTDGMDWSPINKAQSFLVPQIGVQKLLRDPSINKGVDGLFRVVWTTDWNGKEIGYASSPDLIHWSKQQSIPVMKDVKETGHCWAPEIFYDEVQKQYLIYWSSDVGIWSIYYVTTKDFKQFSPPKILFTNGGVGGGKAGNLGPIDAYIFKENSSKYMLFYKKDDNTGVPTLYYRFGKSPTGPWGDENGPIMPSTGDEGPSCIKIGKEYRVYTDPFESEKAYVYITTDLKNWERKVTNLNMSHGSIIEISRKLAIKILKENELK
jgi:hypothetical protein